jgi:hypothetical protein
MAESKASEPYPSSQAASQPSRSNDVPIEKPKKTRREMRRELKDIKKKKLEEEGPPATFKNVFVCSFTAIGI